MKCFTSCSSRYMFLSSSIWCCGVQSPVSSDLQIWHIDAWPFAYSLHLSLAQCLLRPRGSQLGPIYSRCRTMYSLVLCNRSSHILAQAVLPIPSAGLKIAVQPPDIGVLRVTLRSCPPNHKLECVSVHWHTSYTAFPYDVDLSACSYG